MEDWIRIALIAVGMVVIVIGIAIACIPSTAKRC